MRNKMKQKGKRSLAWLVILNMVFCILPYCTIPVSAEEPEQDEDPYAFFVGIDGLEEQDGAFEFKYRVDYSVDDGSSWNNAFPEETESSDGYIIMSDNGDAYRDFNVPDTVSEDWETKFQIKVEIAYVGTAPTPAKEIMFASLGEDDIMSGAEGLTLSYAFDASDKPHDIHIAIAYAGQGEKEITDEADNYLYAYSIDETIISEDEMREEIKRKLATELYYRFIDVAMYGTFDIPNDNPADGINEIENRITDPDKAAGTVTAKDADGNDVYVSYYTATVTWGVDENGDPVTNNLKIYLLGNEDGDESKFIVCTDFSDGDGSEFYIRSVDDQESFSEEGDEGCFIFRNAIQPDKIVAGGNGIMSTQMNNSDGLYVFEVNTMGEWGLDGDYSATVRIMNPSDTYVVINGDTTVEPLHTDGMGVNGVTTDAVWQTGDESKTAQIFIGYSTIYLEAVQNVTVGTGAIETRTITDIALADSTQADGVTIEPTGTKYKVIFQSNFYDSVPLLITYEGGSQQMITVERIGLVISYSYLEDGGTSGEIGYDCKPGNRCSFDFDYNSGEQIIIYATYYYPSQDNTVTGDAANLYLSLTYDDGNTEILANSDSEHNFNGYQPTANGAVATTSFLIGFAHAKEWDGNEWTGDISSQTFVNKYGHAGGFSATVLESGYDDDSTFGGAQAGSGKGVYWDGDIEWF